MQEGQPDTPPPADAPRAEAPPAEAAPEAAQPEVPVEVGQYHDYQQLTHEVRALAEAHPGSCQVESIGLSRDGREIWALRLAMAGDIEPDHRPAMLIAANIDGDHLVGSEVALEVAGRLLERAGGDDEEATRLLREHTLYVVPRVNPDAAEWFFADIKSDHRRNSRPDDADRDGAIDEDPPNDLNGDGLVTLMRVFDPAEADLRADPDEPRLSVEPDRDKGERAEFTLYVEGIDDDGDGEYNEDGPGGVDLNMNFMHGYREHADGAGPYQVSEPESMALLGYVLSHQNIAVVLVYGLHDNLSKTPDGKGTYKPGTPKNIDAKDKGLYSFIGERFREITGLKKAPSGPSDGAFYAWAYAQFGVPSFTTPLWTKPEAKKDSAKDGGDDGGGEDEAEQLTPSGVGDISQETLDELYAAAQAAGFPVTEEMMAGISPQMVERYAKMASVTVRRVSKKKKGGGGGGGGGGKDKDASAWLRYSDEQRDGAGFIAWQKFEHPELGEVEIGGWSPYFKTNPPPERIPEIARKQTEFVLDLAGRFPRVSLDEPEVTRLAPGLYEIKADLVNDGYFPTGTAMAARNHRARPYVVRLEVPNERIVTGRRNNKFWSIPGSGGRESVRWIVRAGDGSDVTVTVFSEKFGRFTRVVRLDAGEETAP